MPSTLIARQREANAARLAQRRAAAGGPSSAPTQQRNVPTAPPPTASGPRPAGDRAAELAGVVQQAGSMASELAGPVGEVSTNFWPAVQQLFHGGEGMTFDQFVANLGGVWDAARGGLQSLGGRLANMMIDFFVGDAAERQLGEGVGYIVGMFAFQAVLDYVSAGTWTGAMAVISQIARFLNWPNAALGEAMQLLSRLGRYILDGARRLGGMIRGAAGSALGRVMAAFTRIGEMLGSFAERLVGRAGAAASHADDAARVATHADDAARVATHPTTPRGPAATRTTRSRPARTPTMQGARARTPTTPAPTPTMPAATPTTWRTTPRARR